METITYNIEKETGNYFNDIQLLCDAVVDYFTCNLNSFYSDYSAYILNNDIEELRSYEEYIYDILSAGIYINTYAGNSAHAPVPVLMLQKKLYLLRRKKANLKPFIDPIRGIISTLFLTAHSNHKPNGTISLSGFKRLILWMEATGEFREESKRLILLAGFMGNRDSEYPNNFFRTLKYFSFWFKNASEGFLKNYTSEVETFLATTHKSYKWKENYIFTGRKRIEYHLSMVGAELMNRAYRQDFLSTKTNAMLVPACMRIKQDGTCRAVCNNFDMKCSGCHDDCRVNRLALFGKQKNFSVHIIPHSSDFTAWLKTWAVGRGIGVVGIACPLNLLTGGLELKSLDIPAQCIPLDYCGCSNHWHKHGIPTKINEDEFIRILDKTAAARVVNI